MFDKYELMLLRFAIGNELWLQKEARKTLKRSGDVTVMGLKVLEERIQRLEAMHEKLSKLIAEAEQPTSLSAKRTKKAMHDLATSSDVLTGDLSNGLEPLSESEDE